jgi:hypothetical protein
MKSPFCRVCRSPHLEQFLHLGDQPHGDSFLAPEDLEQQEPFYPLDTFFCRECTTVQIDYTVPKEVLFEEYLYVSGTTRTLRAHFESSSQRLRSRLRLKEGDLVVDIGSNDGTWLACWQPYELRTLGVDGAKNLAAVANAKGLETWPRFFNQKVAEEIIQSKGSAQLVTAAGVFFHLEELHSVTEGVATLIGESNGVFCIQAIYLGEIIQHTQFDQIYHEHLTYWTLKSLEKLLSLHGLEVFSVQLLPIHGGSMEYLVGKKGGHPIDPSVEVLRQEEKRLGFGELVTYEAFAQRVWGIKAALVDVLTRFQKEGKTVFALGAPIKGSTLLNSFGITSDLVQCAVEVNPLKIGKYMPGIRLQIRDERQAGRPDAYLVLAWNFLPELLEKFREFIFSGGSFIVPIPTPIVICEKNYAQYARS